MKRKKENIIAKKSKLIGILVSLVIVGQIPITSFLLLRETTLAQHYPLLTYSGIVLSLALSVSFGILIGKKYDLFSTLSEAFTRKNIGTMLKIKMLTLLAAALVGAIFVKDITQNDNFILNISKVAPPFLIVLVIGIIAPFMEELLFRGYLIGVLFKNYQLLGCFVSALVFASLHKPDNLAVLSIYVISAMAYCLIYYFTQKLECSLAVHILGNLLSVAAIFLDGF